MKRHLTPIVLLVVTLALALWVWLDRDKVSEGEKQSRANNLFSAWRREELGRIEIAHEGETIVLERDAKTDSSWRMTSPRNERVDQAAAERLQTTLEFATTVRRVEALEKFGLESPRARGAITMGGLVLKFALGAEAPRPEGASYFKVDDNAPVVASKELTDALLASSDTYRDRTVIPYLSLDVGRLEVKHAQGGFTLVRSDDRSFKVDGIGASEASGNPNLNGLLAARGLVDKIWSALAEIRAESFPKDADADRLTANPTLELTMTSKEGKPGDLAFGEVCPGHPNDVVVLRKTPTRIAACAPKGAVEALLAITPKALVDLKPFAFRHDEIEELRLEEIGGKAIEVARRGTGFHEREPTDRELPADEAEAMSDLLSRLDIAHADEIGRGPFTAKYRARARAAEHDDVLEIAALEGDHVLARRAADGALLSLPRSVARMLVPRATTLRAPVLGTKLDEVKHVALRCGTKQNLTDDGTGLKLVDPPGYPTDGSITQLVDAVQKGKVLAWVADADDGTFGFAANGCHVELEKVTISLGAEGEGGVYGRIEGAPEVFVAPTALETLVKRIYVSHAALRMEPAAIAAVKVTTNGREIAGDISAAGDLFADRVLKVGSNDVGAVEVTIALTADAGAKTIVCGAVQSTTEGRWRPCSTSGVKAVFAVVAVRIDRVLGIPDAGAR